MENMSVCVWGGGVTIHSLIGTLWPYLWIFIGQKWTRRPASREEYEQMSASQLSDFSAVLSALISQPGTEIQTKAWLRLTQELRVEHCTLKTWLECCCFPQPPFYTTLFTRWHFPYLPVQKADRNNNSSIGIRWKLNLGFSISSIDLGLQDMIQPSESEQIFLSAYRTQLAMTPYK